MNPNTLAVVMLGGYPLLICLFFSTYKPTRALALSLLVSELILPSKFALPLPYPTWLTKWTLPPLAAFVAVLFFARKSLRHSRPLRGIEASFLILLIGSFMTMWTNRDPLQYGPLYVTGESFGDFFSDAIRSVSDPWVVFFLGRTMFKSSRDLVMLGRMMTVAAICLILPILVELRMSPQFNQWVYGYQPSDFIQTVREGGYRPQVFFDHGLTLSAFLLACLIMSICLARAKYSVAGYPAKVFCALIAITLVACRSMGAIVYAVLFIPVLIWASPKRVTTIASVVMLLFMTYPILRYSGIIPTKTITDLFVPISQERARSLHYRFNMEDGMLDLTRNRPWFGFGGYGRCFVYDPHTGRQETVPDGVVAMTLSSRGFVSFYAYFIPYAFSVLRARFLIRKIRKRSNKVLLSGLTMSCAIILFDLIINSTFFPLFMMLFGILYGMPTAMMREEAEEAQAQAEWDYPDNRPVAAAFP